MELKYSVIVTTNNIQLCMGGEMNYKTCDFLVMSKRWITIFINLRWLSMCLGMFSITSKGIETEQITFKPV